MSTPATLYQDHPAEVAELRGLLNAYPATAIPLLEAVQGGYIDGRRYQPAPGIPLCCCVYGWLQLLTGIYHADLGADPIGCTDLEMLVLDARLAHTPANHAGLAVVEAAILGWLGEHEVAI